MICFEFKIAEANWLTLLLLLRGESARIVSLKTVPGFLPIILLIFYHS